MATLIAHGTNLGLATMAHSVEEPMTADHLHEMYHLKNRGLKAHALER